MSGLESSEPSQLGGTTGVIPSLHRDGIFYFLEGRNNGTRRAITRSKDRTEKNRQIKPSTKNSEGNKKVEKRGEREKQRGERESGER